MMLILKSFALSFGVLGRMIFPVILIAIASGFLWSLLGLATLGVASYISGPVTATFISLFGIRAALSQMGDNRLPDYGTMIRFSVLYGVFLHVLKTGALMLVGLVAVAFAGWQIGDVFSFQAIKNVEETLQLRFTIFALSAMGVGSLLAYTTIYAVMAVPLAGAARTAGHGASGQGFFHGFGRSFIPLFCVFVVSFFLQFFFGLFHALFTMLPLLLSAFTFIFFQTVPDWDAEVLLKGAAASGGLLWLQSWVWAASALALLKDDKQPVQVRKPDPAEAIRAERDIRALRKSRD